MNAASRLRYKSPENKAAIVNEVEKNVWPAIITGKVTPVVYKSFPLSEAAEAHRLMESSKHIGKILLVPWQNDQFSPLNDFGYNKTFGMVCVYIWCANICYNWWIFFLLHVCNLGNMDHLVNIIEFSAFHVLFQCDLLETKSLKIV